MAQEMGLRERKKTQTRQLISDVASGLFIVRGFDNVTVAEVAEAAGVSTKTVFNYFPRKEDLFLDRFPQAVDLVTAAVRGRAEGETPLASLRRLFVGLLEEGHPLGGIGAGYQHFWHVVAESPALRARAREFGEEMEDVVARLFAEVAEAAGHPPGDPRPRIAGALAVAAYRAAYLEGARRIIAGEPAEDVRRDHIVLVGRTFDALEAAVASLYASPVRPVA
ncbi:TetR/AcrR family transcriptional regulator [Microbispora sp. ATCC PTA-5024]|uniref:TetR/AcrR family transcriptional regulator n=1 Tax=Microbispora sp. ATCC PTA-5024 TaxID=316330 RepID=UPI00040B5974|nr:TetR family transcriptional regulator [Microbispora sp. ATCC PTA-5024]